MLRDFCAVCLSAFALIGAAQAGAIIQPVEAISQVGSFDPTFDDRFMVDQSGLAEPYTPGVTDFDTYTATTSTVLGGSSFNTWFSPMGVESGSILFDLGSVQSIDAFALWTDPQGIGQGIRDFRLSVGLSSTGPFSIVGDYTANDGLGGGSNDVLNVAQVFSFTGVLAEYVLLEVFNNHRDEMSLGAPVIGISEVAFRSASEVPIPAAALLFPLGLLVLGSRASSRAR